MPTYDYLCPNGHRFEVIHSVTADGPTVCPVCGASPVRKAFSAPTFHFKGTGWAKKDRSATRRSPSPATSSDGSSSSDTGSDSGTTSTSESGSGADRSGDKSSRPDAAPKSDVTPKPAKPSASAGSTSAD
jgi:putative FmdB family regulatory protein